MQKCNTLQREKADKTQLSSVHPHYQEIAASILRNDPLCLVEADKVLTRH